MYGEGEEALMPTPQILAALTVPGGDGSNYDLIRVVLLSQAGLTYGIVLLLFVTYLQHTRGWPPLHTVLLALSQSAFFGYAVADIANRIGQGDFTWHTPTLIFAMAVSDVALVILLRRERERVRRLRSGLPEAESNYKNLAETEADDAERHH